MNVVFLSPHFPLHFYQFCDRLKRLGVNVLGIGDCPYERIGEACQSEMTEYYYLPSLEDYEGVYRVVAFYIHKYGRIDFVDSQNEYWLETEARLRSDFNIPTGFHDENMAAVNRKSRMKAGYAAAGVKTARWHLVDTLPACRDFIAQAGWPVIVKPDHGVGVADTRKLQSDAELVRFFDEKSSVPYIMEEFVPGHVETFDGITNSRGEILFCTGQVMAHTPLEMVSGVCENISYTQNVQQTDLAEIGPRVVKTFGTKHRFFHFEFFRLDEDKSGLGKKGEILGLEVNMHAPGGYIPDKMNYAYNVDVYQIWAESLVFDENRSFPNYSFQSYVTHFGRDGRIAYAHDAAAVRAQYGEKLLVEHTPPAALSGGMGNQVFLLRADSVDELQRQGQFILERES